MPMPPSPAVAPRPLPLALAAPPGAGPDPCPCRGRTVLVVEDSRQAADTLRLMVMRLGGRMRRAASLAEARSHLSLYRPDAVLVDLGLPDGAGESLIAGLAMNPRRPGRIVALSAYPDRGERALACGADAFVEKPIRSLAVIGAALEPEASPLRISPDGLPPPDPLAVSDDLDFAAARLSEMANDAPDGPPAGAGRGYLAAFLTGLARQTDDPALADEVARWIAGAGDARLLAALCARRTGLGPLP